MMCILSNMHRMPLSQAIQEAYSYSTNHISLQQFACQPAVLMRKACTWQFHGCSSTVNCPVKLGLSEAATCTGRLSG